MTATLGSYRTQVGTLAHIEAFLLREPGYVSERTEIRASYRDNWNRICQFSLLP
jgi:hypothetical protein